LGEPGQKFDAEATQGLDQPRPDSSGRRFSAALPGANLSIELNTARQNTFDYKQTGKTLVGRYDKNSNGYIDKDEMAGNQAPQFTFWDANNDGKVYPEEIAAAYDMQYLPFMTQVRASVTSQANSLFAALDANSDSRLSLREMRTCAERIKTFDKNNDGRVAAEEVPISMKLEFGLGNAVGQVRSFAPGGYGQPARSTGGGGPDWFVRMDRNSDGDITPREFLGTLEQFKKLDTNSDGFIERKEAEAAK
jgi:Ca2+-binding EF-hand superfamily protein